MLARSFDIDDFSGHNCDYGVVTVERLKALANGIKGAIHNLDRLRLQKPPPSNRAAAAFALNSDASGSAAPKTVPARELARELMPDWRAGVGNQRYPRGQVDAV
jgi:hypothetical protein